MKMFTKGLAIAALAALASWPAAWLTRPKSISASSRPKASRISSSTGTPFLADLEKQTGIKVNPFFASDYAGIIEGMHFDKVQIAWYGNKSAMEAVDRADGQVFAQTVDAEGNPGLLVAAASPMSTTPASTPSTTC